MKFTALIAAAVLLVPGLAPAQDLVESEIVNEKVPEAAIASAVQAVGELGKSVVQGRYQVALERMNRKEKQLLVQQSGGLEALEKRLKQVSAEMKNKGVRIISSKPQGKPEAYGVTPVFVRPEGEAAGKGNEKGRWVYSQWLVMVPTVTRFEVLHKVGEQPAKWVEIESMSYQVAVSDRGKNDWTFIDGAGLTVGRLRNHYRTLPADIQLPPVHKRQIQN